MMKLSNKYDDVDWLRRHSPFRAWVLPDPRTLVMYHVDDLDIVGLGVVATADSCRLVVPHEQYPKAPAIPRTGVFNDNKVGLAYTSLFHQHQVFGYAGKSTASVICYRRTLMRGLYGLPTTLNEPFPFHPRPNKLIGIRR